MGGLRGLYSLQTTLTGRLPFLMAKAMEASIVKAQTRNHPF